MSTLLTPPSLTNTTGADRWLKRSVRSWFVCAVLGQWLFAAYVVLFYGGVALSGDLAGWNAALQNGVEAGRPLNTVAIAVHLLLAVIIMVGGPLQFFPTLRARAPRFHRWNGRVYVTTTLVTGLTGLFMIWSHRAGETPVALSGMTLEALLIVLAGMLTWRFAVNKRMQQHQRWAVRLFLIASGVWFFRVMLMGWFLLAGGPVGVDTETMTGPFMDFIYFGHYLLPLAIYELLWRVRAGGASLSRYLMAGLMFLLTGFTVVGVFAAAMGMWLPML